MFRRHVCFVVASFFLAMPALADSPLSEIEQQIEQKQFYKALAKLDELLKQDKLNPHYQFSRARALTGSGQQDKAIAQYRHLIKSYPDLPEAYNNLAVIYLGQGKTDKARRVLEQAMQAHDGYAKVYKNLRALNAAAGRDAYAKALQLPSNKNVKLMAANRLVLQTAAQTSVRPAPTTSAKPKLTYQAKNPTADKKISPEKNTSVNSQRAFAEASKVLHKWARAWSEKKVDEYIQYYSEGYSPAGMSPKYWRGQRKKRINKPKWIRVNLKRLQLQNSHAQNIVIRLEQEYTADSYSDVTRKEFVLMKQGQEWRITKERGLGYVTR